LLSHSNYSRTQPGVQQVSHAACECVKPAADGPDRTDRKALKMSLNAKTAAPLLVCNCQKTMQIDGAGLAEALGLDAPLTVHTELCRSQLQDYQAALAQTDGTLRVACTQEAALFSEVADAEDRPATLSFVNIRERAGWCSQPAAALPKLAALLADAAYVSRATGLTSLTSEGICLVYAAGQAAFDAAEKLSGRLSVTLVISDDTDVILPSRMDFSVHRGKIRSVTGHLGAFHVTFDDHADLLPSSRATPQFALPRRGLSSQCDLIVDLSGNAALFRPEQRRDGYFRADPGRRADVADALFAASDMVGEFEKPLYVSYDASICAHARSGKVGCRNCLDVCPTGAITPHGDAVAIDPAICGGCGSCAASCPTGAVSYSYPQRSDLVARAQILLAAYRGAGGVRPVLMLHDETHGAPLINMMARYGRGLPPNVIPIAQHAVFQTGHETLLAMLASGAAQVVCLIDPAAKHERPALDAQVELCRALLSGLGHSAERIVMIDTNDPDQLETLVHELDQMPALDAGSFATQGTKRELARLAVSHLASLADTAPPETIALPQASPYGRLVVDTEGCTLCLACVGACPTGALSDNPDRPQVAFTEAACVQCGLCMATCPETVIALDPRYNFSAQAMSPTILKTEDPFDCVRCGKPFGARSSVETVVERLRGHAMFADEAQLRLIQMCDDCRVITVSEGNTNPFAFGTRPRTRTTTDYLAEDAAPKRPAGRDPDDFLS